MTGRRRSRTKQYPPGIDAGKLPKRCYWDPVRRHWYTVFEIDGKQRRARIAGADAKLSELHHVMEVRAGEDVNNFIWLRKKYTASPQYLQLAKKTQDGYDYCARVVETHPSKLGNLPVGKVPLGTWNPAASQKLIDQIGVANGPSAANACMRYLRLLFNWSVKRGYIQASPLGSPETPKERKRRRLPAHDTLDRLIPFARARGALPAHSKGSCAPYIWQVLVIAQRCRLRGVEILSLTEDLVLEQGLYGKRTKGSRDSITRWSPDLRDAVDQAMSARDAVWADTKRPIPLRPEQRLLIVNETGDRVRASTWQSAWRRMLDQAEDAKAITAEERFGLHDMKRRSITDTKGGRAAKLDAGGHREERMLEVYDFEVPEVDAAGT